MFFLICLLDAKIPAGVDITLDDRLMKRMRDEPNRVEGLRGFMLRFVMNYCREVKKIDANATRMVKDGLGLLVLPNCDEWVASLKTHKFSHIQDIINPKKN